ncbi:MAG: SigB/SigF/SigG family RNA polymerase sigma factor [Solirubrobacteraceae bacterium]
MATRERTRQTDEELLRAYGREGDQAAREELVERYLPFARKLALRYVRSHEPLEDLVQVACLGLLNAIERFQPGRGTTFVGFAAPTIIGEIKRHFRDKGWAVHVPRRVKETALGVSRDTERLSSRLGRSPTVDELAREVNATVEQVIEALDAGRNYRAASLDAPAAPGQEDALGDTLGAEDEGFEVAEDRQAIAASWGQLNDAEREVLRLRLVHELSQREIGERVGCSQMHVSRLLRRSLRRLDPAAGVGSGSIGRYMSSSVS